MKSAGLVSLGGYIPAKLLSQTMRNDFCKFLRKETLLNPEYIQEIEEQKHLPGRIETNYEGWEKQPWFSTWLEKLPAKKKEQPFQGACERRRVPLDPNSLKNSICPHPMLSSDAETIASALAIFNGKINKEDIDLLIVHSFVPDCHLPLNASLVQHKLGLKNCGAYNVDTACSSFITLMEMAMMYVSQGLKKNVLIVSSYIDSLITDKSIYNSVNWGDGAVAGIVSEVSEGYGYLSSHSTSDGSWHSVVTLEKRHPELLNTAIQGPSFEQEFLTFGNPEIFKDINSHIERGIVNVVNKTLEKVDKLIAEVDFLITGQPTAWSADAWRKAIGISSNKFYQSFEKYANIAACSAPLNLLEAIEQDLIKNGDIVLMVCPGAGENHIALLHRISTDLMNCQNN